MKKIMIMTVIIKNLKQNNHRDRMYYKYPLYICMYLITINIEITISNYVF